ncbi:MAG: 2Fe-2S iron-sulfur cluster binding domain-containing protein [Bacteroidetes bacterium]|nr:MAG: 2Fe-2S iron-sulfur cluster binding domain-containing protein [Bacteroidota bacterium]
MNSEITVYVLNDNGEKEPVVAPTDMALSLMEVLKGSGYPIEARCGGMALCATCHVEVLNDVPLTPENDDEMAMLDTVPNITPTSRLGCQIKITEEMDGLEVRILGDQ